MKTHYARLLVVTMTLGSTVQPAHSWMASGTSGIQFVSFQSQVGNVEYAASRLAHVPPSSARYTPMMTGQAWFGGIMRRLPSDSLQAEAHYVPIAVEYLAGRPHRAWCDQNLDGDLVNDGSVALSPYPGLDGTKSFLVDLKWAATYHGRVHNVQWKVRVVLEPETATEIRPLYRVQRVFAPMGTVLLDEGPHRAFLFDGNGDGLYTKEPLDGVFVDLNDDRHIDVNPLSSEFGPFRIPVQLGQRVYEVKPLDPQGTQVAVRLMGRAAPTRAAAVGELVPELNLDDVDGHSYRLTDFRGRALVIYFWASWCGACRRQACELLELFARYPREKLEIFGVSYDSDFSEMQQFMRAHRETWPTSFSGGIPSEDPVGRAFKQSGAGVLYLIGPAGYLEGVYYDVDSLTTAISGIVK